MWAVLASLALAGDPGLAVREAVADRLGVPLADVELVDLGAAGLPTDVEWRVDLPAVGPWWGTVPLVVRSPDGVLRYALRSRITVWQELPVAARAVGAGEPVEVTLARLPRERLRGEVPVDPSASWEARVDLGAGTPLTTARVRPRPDREAGSLVTIVAGSERLWVAANGRLGEDAFVGRPVRVANLDTHAVLVGVYQPDGSVRVGGVR